MHVVKKRTLVEFWQKHANAKAPLSAWDKEADAAEWKTPQDVKDQYRSADILPGNRIVFNFGGNKYRLVVRVAYKPGLLYVRFIGTHAEYDRIDATKI
ncbi:type II toxin-antitoxin system HigB family toxin [Pontiellaceae bacterium B12227]|nr:type II toxin-antitoxin system HigB family toxin [Pontiellaceae bacterium B12227]